MQGRFNNSNDVSQNNKRKLPVKETTAKKIKRQQTSSSSSAESFVGSSEEFESASSPEDSETENSDAGDIPYEKDLPRQVVSQVFCCFESMVNDNWHCSSINRRRPGISSQS